MGTMTRKIIQIDEDRCDGCGLCVPSCAEGAIRIIDGKARLVSDRFCDGLGACLGECPNDALKVIEREAEEFDEEAVEEHLKAGVGGAAGPSRPGRSHGHQRPTARPEGGSARTHSHQRHSHASAKSDTVSSDAKRPGAPRKPTTQSRPGSPAARVTAAPGHVAPVQPTMACGCPSTQVRSFVPPARQSGCQGSQAHGMEPALSALSHWPVQIRLVPPSAPFLKNADLLVLADCVGAAYPDLHRDLLPGKVVMMGCPKFDDADSYVEKFAQIFRSAGLKSITVGIMEVPCCGGLYQIAARALELAEVSIPLEKVVIGVKGDRQAP